MTKDNPECPTCDCRNCLHLPYCTKDEPNYNPMRHPTNCPECGFWILGLLADGTGVACLSCGHVVLRPEQCKICGSEMLKVKDEEPVCTWCGSGLDPYFLETPEVVN